MTIQDVQNYLGAAALLISVGGAIYVWLTAGSKTNAKDLDALRAEAEERHDKVRDDLKEHDRRIQSVESELKHLPDKDTVIELKLAIADLKGTVGRLEEGQSSVQRTVLRIDDYLRQDRGK